MKYNKEEGRIEIELSEFVGIARRKISSTLPFDSDEPYTGVKKIDKNLKRIFYDFKIGETNYRLRADVLLSAEGSLIIERTVTSSPSHPKKEETAQIRGEGYVAALMLIRNSSLSSVTVEFRYVNLFSGESNEKTETLTEKRLVSFFNKCALAIAIYAIPEIERVTERLPSLSSLKFPYKSIREAQREFIGTAYKTLSRGGKLYASAPTGTGKTVSALYPALRALGDGKVDKVFYFTPKGTTAEAAKECLGLMTEHGAKLKAVILNAKDKCCEEGRVCKLSRKLCKNSQCNNLAEATIELYESNIAVVDTKNITPVSRKYTVCPYELSLTYAELCDVVICDFNYLFDPFSYIRRFFDKHGKYVFLVDEAHNLAERVREGYSAELCDSDLSMPESAEILGEFSKVRKAAGKSEEVFKSLLHPYVKEEIREINGQMLGASHTKSIPERLYTLIDELLSLTEEELLINYRAQDEEREERIKVLHDYYYLLKSFSEILGRFDDAYEMFIFYEDGKYKVKLFCLDTGSVIRDRLAKGHSALLFSATLSPLDYYRAILGGDRSDGMIELSSPFDPSQLSVSIMDRISTRFSERENTLAAVLRAVVATISAKRGNYMIFSPSFAYSEALSKLFISKYPKLRVITQKRNMSMKEKEEFLEEFRKDDRSYLVAFCVMGGIYSEGIDLAGDSLIGAVVIGTGIPALSYEREAIAAYYDEKYESGKQFAYIYPGMNRVFQAAGRVIRREEDRGVIVLIDDRFDDPIYKKSLPDLWEGLKFIQDAKDLKAELDEFWNQDGAIEKK